MKRNKQQIEDLTKELLSNGWTQSLIDEVGFCPGCGSFGIEECDDNCPELLNMLNDPDFQRQCLQDEMESNERKAGWDPNP